VLPTVSDAGWRIDQAAALEEQVAAIGRALVALDDMHAIAVNAGNPGRCSEIRSLASALRSDATALMGVARELRLSVEEMPAPLPMHVTRRVG
jgi:hypothetical protein